MKLFPPVRLFSLLAGVCLAAPLSGQAKQITYYRDRDHDGHYVAHHVEVGHDDHGHGFRGGRYYGGYGYGFPFHRPFYGYGYGYPYEYEPSVSVSYYGGRRYDRDNSDDLAVDVQRALKRRGYYGGPVDGDIGAGTRHALRRYQSEHRLDPSGRIDRDTLRALGL